MLQSGVYRRVLWKKRILEWLRRISIFSGGLLFLATLVFVVQSGSSRQLVRMLSDQQFPFQALLLEGASGLSQPERGTLDQARQQGSSLGMFLFTGVNMADARTFFLSYFTPPPQGPAWIGWAYNPRDPEFEGQVVDHNPTPGSGTGSLPPNSGSNVPSSSGEAGQGEIPAGKATSVLVGIYHTHNGESYAGDGGPDRKKGEGDVVTVGETLKQSLLKNGIDTVHALDINDAYDFMQAYSHSYNTATTLLKRYPNIRLLFDIHRDGLPPGVNKLTTTIKGQEAATVMIVIGQRNPHWEVNEKLAQELIQLGNQMYPGLFESQLSYAADARYNENLSDGSLLLEVGSQLNTLAEANRAATAAGDVIASWLRNHPGG